MQDKDQLNILLVEDDDLSRRMMSLLLSDQGYSFDTVANGVEAVDAVKTQKYDFVLMDLQMPLLDGFEATRTIRTWEDGKQHIPIVALTAMLFQDEINLCMEAGMDDCISKPFDTKDLHRMIETYVQRSAEPVNIIPEKKQTNDDALMLDVKEALLRFDNNVQNYQEFLREYIELLPGKVEEFQSNFSAEDFETLSQNAHKLKGVSASLGAMQLSRLANNLDQLCYDKNSSLIRETLAEIEEKASLFKENAMEELSRYIKDNDVGA